MPSILCPTRGGELSYPNQDMAIELARERNATIVFLYVSNIQFLMRRSSALPVDLADQLDDMGEFLCEMAIERAEKAGVVATGVIRRGDFQEALRETISEEDIIALVLGGPEEETGSTTEEYLSGLAKMLADEYSLETFIVCKGQVQAHTKPQKDV